MKLKDLRISRTNYTQKEFAKKIGVKNTTVSMWETGKSKPKFDTILKIAEICSVNTDVVIDSIKKQVG